MSPQCPSASLAFLATHSVWTRSAPVWALFQSSKTHSGVCSCGFCVCEPLDGPRYGNIIHINNITFENSRIGV